MILPDTRITCPNCDLHIATTNTVVEQEDDGSLAIQDFDWNKFNINSQGVIAGYCPSCNENWSDTGGYVHTEDGWEEV